jgi:hypothetical protein
LDVVTVKKILTLRGRMGDKEVEEALGLQRGLVGKLGVRGRVFNVVD